MNRHNSNRNAIDLHYSVVFGTMLMVCLPWSTTSQQRTELRADRAKVRQRIVSIVHATLTRGEMTTTDGHRIIVRAKPEDKDIEEIRSYGDDAVTVLADFLNSEDAREYELTGG